MVLGMNMTQNLEDILEISPYFQRSILLDFDLGNPVFLDFFAPTPGTVEAISKVLKGIDTKSRDRSHVLLGAYGTGKSLVGLVLGAILNPTPEIVPALWRLQDRIRQGGWFELADRIEECLSFEGQVSTKRLLPVVMSGNYTDLSLALIRASQRALERENLQNIRTPAIYQAVLETLDRWQKDWPSVYLEWQKLAEIKTGKNPDLFRQELQQGIEETYRHFCEIYPLLTAGAHFDPYSGNFRNRVGDWLEQFAESLKVAGWQGFVIIWDEFGRFLEERANEAFGQDAQLLQELAERCTRTGSVQMHLVLITHKSLRQYGRGIAGGVDKEWGKIEGRFSSIEISSDPNAVYNLIERGLKPTNSTTREAFINEHKSYFEQLYEQTSITTVFKDIPDRELRHLIVEGAYPLHPLATFCLPRLSDRVGQNQRTLFTFLVADDEDSLPKLWRHSTQTSHPRIILAGQLYDYFAAGMRAATEAGGAHWIWSAVERARPKVQEERLILLLKTLAVMHVSGAYEGGAPTTELIAFAMGALTSEERANVGEGLNTLASRRIIFRRKLNNGWEFVQWASDFDINQEISNRLQSKPPSLEVLRSLLTAVLPPPVYQARRYNDDRGMVRYFNSQYCLVKELENDASNPPNWDHLLKEQDYGDGLVLYALPFNELELARARNAAILLSQQHPRVLCVVPSAYLGVREVLEDLYGLKQIKQDFLALSSDTEEIKELDFLEEDNRMRLELALLPLVDPRHRATWFLNGLVVSSATNPGAVSRLISEICSREFYQTPRIYNENFNKRRPAPVQVAAGEKVVNAVLFGSSVPNLGLTGYGPDIAILNSFLVSNRLVSADGEILRPDSNISNEMVEVWRVCESFYQKSLDEGLDLNLEELVDQLQSPPFGLRKGVLPLLLALTFKDYLAASTIRRNGVSVAISGKAFIEIVSHPSLFTVQIEQVDEQVQRLLSAVSTRVEKLLRPEELKEQQLRYLSQGLLRWLQGLPRYSRDTSAVSKTAIMFRRLIRSSIADPTRALLKELPNAVSSSNELNDVMEELEKAYEALLDRIRFIISEVFEGQGDDLSDFGLSQILANWYGRLTSNKAIERLFADPVAEELAKIGKEPNLYEKDLIKVLTKRVVGTEPRDWNDALEKRFSQKLKESRELIEKEITFLEKAESGEVVTTTTTDAVDELVVISLKLPGETDTKQYDFRKPVNLSTHGHQLAESLRRTIEISGRSLDIQEKRAIALELLRYIIEGKVQ